MTLRLEHDGPIARLLIDRPARRNAMTQAMWEDAPRLVAQASRSRHLDGPPDPRHVHLQHGSGGQVLRRAESMRPPRQLLGQI